MARILIVDDENVITTVLRLALSREGHEVVTASSGADALEKAAADRPDLVISDVQMPGMSGFELVRQLNDQMPAIACILMSGHAFATPETSREQLEGLRVAAILKKPFQIGGLMQAVNGALSHSNTTSGRVQESEPMVAQGCA